MAVHRRVTTAKKPVAVTLDQDLLDELQRLVSAGEVASLSAVINDTMRSRIEARGQAQQARACIEEDFLDGEPLTEEELRQARGMLAVNKARTAARLAAWSSVA